MSEVANANLHAAGAKPESIFFVGNTMIDTLLANLPRLRAPDFWAPVGLQPGGYFVMTLHRLANVDDAAGFARLIHAVGEATRGLPVVLPVYPRTAKTPAALPDRPAGPMTVEPQPYPEFNHIVRHAKDLITDSGGVTEETTVLGVPCVTLRDTTERPETVTSGTNELIGTDPTALKPALDWLLAGQWKKDAIPALWDGRIGERIAEILDSRLLR